MFLNEEKAHLKFYTRNLIPKTLQSYYFYNGSFIDSDCHEPVTWIVDKRVRAISNDHIAVIRSRMSRNTLKNQNNHNGFAQIQRSLIKPLGTR